MKPFTFYGQPRSDAGLPSNLTPARLCALAWVRSNFPEGADHEILAVERDQSSVTVTMAQDIVSFDFGNEMDAARAVKQLPPVMECQSQFMLATEVDMEALSREMNFGASFPDMECEGSVSAPTLTI